VTEEEKIELSAMNAAKQKSLELLFDYTKFHIGLYLTLTAAYVVVATAKLGETPILTLIPEYFWPAVVAFMVAGLSGGVIASSITQTTARSSAEFLLLSIGPWEVKAFHFRARIWTWIEHTAFWLGLVMAVLSFRK
jgi:hypothetical protein